MQKFINSVDVASYLLNVIVPGKMLVNDYTEIFGMSNLFYLTIINVISI